MLAMDTDITRLDMRQVITSRMGPTMAVGEMTIR